MAPVSIPEPAWTLQLSFGLREKLGKGKLLGGGARVNTEPENFSKSPKITPAIETEPLPEDDEKTLEATTFGRSFGSGPNRFVDAMTKDSVFTTVEFDFKSCFFGVVDGLGFLGHPLNFLLVGEHEKSLVRGGREAYGLVIGRGRRGGCADLGSEESERAIL